MYKHGESCELGILMVGNFGLRVFVNNNLYEDAPLVAMDDLA